MYESPYGEWVLVIEVDEFGHDQTDARWQEIRKDCEWCQSVLIRINPNGPQKMLTKRTMLGTRYGGPTVPPTRRPSME